MMTLVEKYSVYGKPQPLSAGQAAAKTLQGFSDHGEGQIEGLQRRVNELETMLSGLVGILLDNNRVPVLETIELLLPSYKLEDK